MAVDKKKAVRGLEVQVSCKDTKKHQLEVADALKELKKQIKKAGIMQELRKREHYVPPSKARTIKRNESLKQRKRDERKAMWYKNNNDA